MNAGRIGILGGSFDPVHNGHLAIARAAVRARRLDFVLLIPAAVQPFKRNGPRAPGAARLDMLRAATARDPRLQPDPLELERGGVSFLYETLCELRLRHPGATLFFIIGMDSLLDLHAWRYAGRMLEMCEFLTAARPGVVPPKAADIRLPDPWPQRLLANIIPCPAHDVSSSEIRQRVSQKLPVAHLLPRGVASRIRRHALYQTQETHDTP
jgi:nicotinate-nucleotide adenylyltransferase